MNRIISCRLCQLGYRNIHASFWFRVTISGPAPELNRDFSDANGVYYHYTSSPFYLTLL